MINSIIVPILKIVVISSVFFVWFVRYQNIVEEFKVYGYSSNIRDLVGILKISSVLLIQSSNIQLVQIGSALLAFLMLAALMTHLKIKNSPLKFAPSLTLLIFSIAIFINV